MAIMIIMIRHLKHRLLLLLPRPWLFLNCYGLILR